jgi:hypothetical protein
MKKKPLAYFLTKKFYYVPLILLGTVNFLPGCQKKSRLCDDIVSEGTPTQVGLTLIDRQTGENILLSKNVDPTTIKITSETTGVPAEQGMIVTQSGAPLYGALVFNIADTKKGAFKYKISIPNVDTATLSYSNREENSNSPCSPTYIVVGDPVIEDHQFTLTRTADRLLFKVTL